LGVLLALKGDATQMQQHKNQNTKENTYKQPETFFFIRKEKGN